MLTILHVAFGTVALLVVPAALVTRKGGTWHQRWGIAFTASMSVVLLSSLFLWQAKGHLFLVPLAAVSAYLIFSGWRVLLRRRRRQPDSAADRIDLIAAGVAVLAGLFTAFLGATAATPLMISIRPALLGIGTIAICFAASEVLGFYSPRTKAGWLLAHLSSMLAGYISAVTAFLVINAHHVPMILCWLVPSSIGAATIVAFSLRVVGPAMRASIRRGWPRPAPEIGDSAAGLRAHTSGQAPTLRQL